MPPRVAPGHVPVRIAPDGTRERRCYDHPHRVVESACARCRVPYCADCLSQVGAALATRDVSAADRACARCVSELESLAAIRAWAARPWWRRWRPTRAGARTMAITTVVLGMIAAPVAYIVRDIVDSPITPEEFARIAIALRGGFAGPDGTNYLNVVFGGTFLRTSAPAVPGHEPTRLIDTWATARVPGWRSAAPLPVEMAFALPDRTIANRVILRPHPAEPVGTWAREFEVSFSIGSPEGPWTPVVASALDPSKVSAPPVTGDGPRGDDRFHVPPFDVPETPVRWVRLVVSSNGGSPDYTSLGEFEVLYSAPGTRTSPVPPDRGPQGRAGG